MPRFIPSFWVLILAVFCLTGAGCQAGQKIDTTLAAGQEGALRFPTRDVQGFREMVVGDKAYDSTTLGRLYLPPEASREDRVPVMVILHGSGGEWSGRGKRQAHFLAQHGVGALVVDTFAGRGLKKRTKYVRRLMSVNVPDQLTDAFAALELLQTHPLVDGSRIGVMGYSMGGMSSILASFETIAHNASTGNHRFALHVSFYAPCIIFPENGAGTGAPVVCLWGTEDGATPRADCREMVEFLENGGNPVKALWYEGAVHGWNGLTPPKFYETIPNFAGCRYTVREDGSMFEHKTELVSLTDKDFILNSEHCVSYGYTIGRQADIEAQANQALLEAIETSMPNQGR